MKNYNLSNLELSWRCVPFSVQVMVEGQLPVSVDFFKVLFGTLWSWFYLEKQKETKVLSYKLLLKTKRAFLNHKYCN